MQRLEKVFIARRLLFKKVTILQKDQSLKMIDAICNLPIGGVDVCNSVPVLQIAMLVLL